MSTASDFTDLERPVDPERFPEGTLSLEIGQDGDCLFHLFPDASGIVTIESTAAIRKPDGKGFEHVSGPFIQDQFDALPCDPTSFRSAAGEVLGEPLLAFFWEHVNDKLDDPFLEGDPVTSDALEGEEMSFAIGGEDAFRQVLTLMLHAQPWAIGKTACAFSIDSKCADRSATMTELPEDCDAAFTSLLDLLLDHFQPQGFEYEYNDGPSDRMSGYSEISTSLYLEIDGPSAHEHLEAIERLKAWLAETYPEKDSAAFLPVPSAG